MARIKVGLQDCLYLGNLDAKRDWGHARDFVEAQWLMLQQEKPEDFVIATGEQHSVREFVDAAANKLGITLRWKGKGVEEIGVIKHVDTKPSDNPGPSVVSVITSYSIHYTKLYEEGEGSRRTARRGDQQARIANRLAANRAPRVV